MRFLAVTLVAVPALAAAEPCRHFDLLPQEGVDLELVSALRERMRRSGVASTGDLEDCPVRLAANGDEVDVDVELEDRIVSRSFARRPPREAAWAIALLLDELAGVEGQPRDGEPPPEEIIPTVEMPGAPPDLTPTPRAERRVPPPGPTNRVAVGFRALEGLAAHATNVTVEWAALSVDAAFGVSFLPRWLAPAVLADWHLPSEFAGTSFQSLQIGGGAELTILSGLRLSLTSDLALLLRTTLLDPGLPERATLRPGGQARVRLELRLSRWLGVALAIVGAWVPSQLISCRDRERCTEADVYSAPWEAGGGLDVVFHL